MPKKVWVLEEEHSFEGAVFYGVYSTRELALAAVSWCEPHVTGFFLTEAMIDKHDEPNDEYIRRPKPGAAA